MIINYSKKIACFKHLLIKQVLKMIALLFIIIFGQFNLTYGVILADKNSAESDSAKISDIKLYFYSMGTVDTNSLFHVSVFSSNGNIAEHKFRLKKKGDTTIVMELTKELPVSKLSDLHLKLSRDSSRKLLIAFSIKVLIGKTDSTVDNFIQKTPLYYCLGDTTILIPSLKNIKKPKNIAIQDSIAINAAVFNNINSLPDNDPSGFTQFYISASIPFRGIYGIPHTSHGWNNLIWFRNLYITPTLNSSKLSYARVDSINGDYHVNSLDLLQYAYFKVPFIWNIATYVNHYDSVDYSHLYFDFITEWIFTKDTIKSIRSSKIITSFIWGPGFYYKSEEGISKYFTLEAGLSIFQINALTNSLKADLNVQYRNLGDTSLVSNASKSLIKENNLFYSMEAFVTFWISTSVSTYLHLNYTHNIGSADNYANDYFQIQLGFNLDVNNFFRSISKGLKGT